MAIDYFRKDPIELDCSVGIEAGAIIVLALGGLLIWFGFVGRNFGDFGFGGLVFMLGLLGAIQRLFDRVVYLIDPAMRRFAVRRYVWGKLDKEMFIPLDDLNRFEIENREDERWNQEGRQVRIVARMKSGERIPLIPEFSHRDLGPRVDRFNTKLVEVQEIRLSQRCKTPESVRNESG